MRECSYLLLAAVVSVGSVFAREVRETFDFNGPFDGLSKAKAISFRFECDDAGKVERRFVYFTNANGHFQVPFDIEGKTNLVVRVDRNDCVKEIGAPGRWDATTKITVSFWRNADTQVKWKASKLKALREEYDVVVSVLDGGTHPIAKRIEACGPRVLSVKEAELSDSVLANAKLLVPIGGKTKPTASGKAAQKSFQTRGGKIMTYGDRMKLTTHESMRSFLKAKLPELHERFAAYETANAKRIAAGKNAAADFPKIMRQGGDGEMRFMLCHTAYGPERVNDAKWENWDYSCGYLKGLGFNGVSVNVCRGGIAFYDSKVLPMSDEVATKGDAVQLIKAACEKHGMKFIAWKVCFKSRKGMKTKEFERWIDEGRGAVSIDGVKDDEWLCPVQAANRRLEVEAMVELAKMRPWAVALDYIRYSSEDWCFCEHCRAAFETHLGRKVEGWPKAVKHDAELAVKWAEFKENAITSLVRDIARRMRVEAPGVLLTADVAATRSRIETRSQRWDVWCREELLDFVKPMSGFENMAELEASIRFQLSIAGGKSVIPTYYPSTARKTDYNAADLVESIATGRKLGLKGFSIFTFDSKVIELLTPIP